ncbi:MAG: hypothetical protein SYC29_10920, partial [Planctomycetota bacterium]|nr:hypothetical protein [Planctomycetota bacterium]
MSCRSVRLLLCAVMPLLCAADTARAQLRVVNYNIASLNGDQSALRDVFEALNEDDKVGFTVAPHLYIFQEVCSDEVAVLHSLLNDAAPPGVTYGTGTYTNHNENGVAGAQAMFYRTDGLEELAAGHDDIYTGA